MNKQVDPKVLIGAGIILLALILFFGYRSLAPQPEAYTISPPGLDVDGAAAKRANHQKMLNGQAAGGAAPAASTDTRQ